MLLESDEASDALPGIEMSPITLIWLTVGRSLRKVRRVVKFCREKHVRQPQGIPRQRKARLHPAPSEREVRLDLIPVVRELAHDKVGRDSCSGDRIPADHSPGVQSACVQRKGGGSAQDGDEGLRSPEWRANYRKLGSDGGDR